MMNLFVGGPPRDESVRGDSPRRNINRKIKINRKINRNIKTNRNINRNTTFLTFGLVYISSRVAGPHPPNGYNMSPV